MLSETCKNYVHTDVFTLKNILLGLGLQGVGVYSLGREVCLGSRVEGLGLGV